MAVIAPSTDAAVPDLWSSLGLPGLVDVHTHFMPDNVMRKVRAALSGPSGLGWTLTYEGSTEARLNHLRELGVRAFTSLVYAHRPGMAAWLNTWAAEFAAATPECVPSATFFPEPGVEAYLDEALTAGARVCKVHLQVGGYDPRDPLLDPVWARLAADGVPVITHCGSGPEPGAFTGPGPIGEVLAAHPELRLVIAHMGAPEYREFAEVALRYPHVHLDTTMVFTAAFEALSPYPREVLERLAAHPDRVVLGTDSPNMTHAYADQLAALVELDLGDDWLRAVCHDNGARLLGVA